MKRTLSAILIVSATLFSANTNAQNVGDTITVKTFNYSQTYGINQWSPGIRDSVISFPDLQGITFEKILMKYNMRCKNGLVSPAVSGQTDLGCGEWDASCNTYIHDSTKIDSVQYTHPSHIISGFSGTPFNYTNQALFDYYQYSQQQVNLNNIVSENQYQLLSGTTTINEALAGDQQSGKAQYLYTAAELTASGFSAGNIDGFLLEALTAGTMNYLRVRIKGTSATALDATSPEINGFSEVYFSNYTFSAGNNRIQFYTPYAWNGTDNLIIELSFTNTVPESVVQLQGTNSGTGIVVNNGYYQTTSANGHIDVPVGPLSSITDQVTVSFWARGDASQLPANTTIIEGLGANDERDLNVHLPWSNSQIYWDCGGDGSVDRINQSASSNEFEGEWHHWAFLKNANTGSMEIYLDGTLWHSGTGKTRPIDIAKLVVGKSGTYGNNYKGSINELRIWDKALSASDIQNWMNIPLTAAHPEYANLVAYYPFNEGTGVSLNDASVNAETATSNGATVWSFERGKDLDKFFTEVTNRPNITLVQGTYDTSITPVNTIDSVAIAPNTVEEFTILSNAGTLMDDEVSTVSTTYVWQANAQNIYDAATGNIIGTIPVSTDGTIGISDLDYYRRWPMKFEIMSFVTPYGIGLDLGPDGKTWTFDVTDYAPILKGAKRMTIERGGQWMEDMDIQFEFIVGTPPRDIVDINQIWRAESRGYTDIINNRFFAPRDVVTDANSDMYKVRTAITGHGQEGEFIPQQHFININGGSNEDQWEVWKECAENPIYPQGGTWVYDRAGWCPGMATDVRHLEITETISPNQTVTIDYGVLAGQGTSNYIVNSQFVQYGPINHAIDASIVEVLEPSNRVEFQRFNTICNEPKVRIRNTGSTELTSLTISYWVNSSTTPQTYNWTGNLAFLEEEVVTLPSPIDLWNPVQQTGNDFHVSISNPNGGTDEYTYNDKYVSKFDIPEVMPNHLVIWFRTNNAPNESSYEIVEEYSGNVIHSRSGMSANTLYKDTIQLGIGGCYAYRVHDSDDDGIAWWANNDGNGYTRFQEVGGPIIKTFEPDFGNDINFHFTVDFPLSYEEINNIESVEVYPNPTNDNLNLSLRGFANAVSVELIDQLGHSVYKENINTDFGMYKGTIPMDDIRSGVYLLYVSDENQSVHVKVVKQ